jgi:hypothetical protein
MAVEAIEDAQAKASANKPQRSVDFINPSKKGRSHLGNSVTEQA